MEEKSKTAPAHCNKCAHETQHTIIYAHCHSDTYGDPSCPCSWWKYYEILECCGCKEVVFRTREGMDDWVDVDYNSNTIEWNEDINYFPPPALRARPKWADTLNQRIETLLDEVYLAIPVGAFQLSAMGIRAILDTVLQDKLEGDIGTFAEKLDRIVEKGFVSNDNRLTLEAALELGHAATHRNHKPRPDDINTALDIVEHLLKSVYILPIEADKLKSATPPRRKSTKSKSNT